MITIRDLLNNVELQSTAKYFYYDKEQRIELTEQEAGDCKMVFR